MLTLLLQERPEKGISGIFSLYIKKQDVPHGVLSGNFQNTGC